MGPERGPAFLVYLNLGPWRPFFLSIDFDRRSPVEKCQSQIADSYGASEDLMVAASLADSTPEAECVRGLTKRSSDVSVKSLVDCTQDGIFLFLKRLGQVNL